LLVAYSGSGDGSGVNTVSASRIFAAQELHGDCSQGARTRALDAFASVTLNYHPSALRPQHLNTPTPQLSVPNTPTLQL